MRGATHIPLFARPFKRRRTAVPAGGRTDSNRRLPAISPRPCAMPWGCQTDSNQLQQPVAQSARGCANRQQPTPPQQQPEPNRHQLTQCGHHSCLAAGVRSPQDRPTVRRTGLDCPFGNASSTSGRDTRFSSGTRRAHGDNYGDGVEANPCRGLLRSRTGTHWMDSRGVRASEADRRGENLSAHQR